MKQWLCSSKCIKHYLFNKVSEHAFSSLQFRQNGVGCGAWQDGIGGSVPQRSVRRVERLAICKAAGRIPSRIRVAPVTNRDVARFLLVVAKHPLLDRNAQAQTIVREPCIFKDRAVDLSHRNQMLRIASYRDPSLCVVREQFGEY